MRGTPTGVLRSCYREGTSLHRPLGASLWFVTPTSLRFCVMEPLNFDLGSTGTFTCSVPSSGQMYLINESMFFSSSGVPNMLNCCNPSAQCSPIFHRDVDSIHRFGLLPVRALLQHKLDPIAMLSIPQRSLWTTSACQSARVGDFRCRDGTLSRLHHFILEIDHPCKQLVRLNRVSFHLTTIVVDDVLRVLHR